jgi:taurine dioxygenase
MTMLQEKPVDLPFAPTPLSDVLGAEVCGFDVRDLADPAVARAVTDYLRDCQVLVFRDQTLSQAELVSFVRMLGRPQYHVLKQFALQSTPEIYVLSNIKEENTPVGNAYEGMGWHTDLVGHKENTDYTVLYGLEIPPVGGATCFASMYRAYEALPAERRKSLDGLKFIYNYGTQYTKRLKFLADKGITDHAYDKPLSPEQQIYAAQRHPLPIVDVNPFNGRKWLHLAAMGCAGVEGMADEDGIAFVENLIDWATSSPFRYDHAWRKGDLVMWDNYGLFHVAGDYDKAAHRRLIWRCSVARA